MKKGTPAIVSRLSVWCEWRTSTRDSSGNMVRVQGNGQNTKPHGVCVCASMCVTRTETNINVCVGGQREGRCVSVC